DRMFVVQYAGFEDFPVKYASSVIWNSLRLVGKDELYNLENDPGQKNNIASKFPLVREAMRDFYENWWREVEGQQSYVPLILGNGQNSVVLTSDFWSGPSVNTQWKVAQGDGDPRGGVWNIKVKSEGKYLIELSRWPFHLN